MKRITWKTEIDGKPITIIGYAEDNILMDINDYADNIFSQNGQDDMLMSHLYECGPEDGNVTECVLTCWEDTPEEHFISWADSHPETEPVIHKFTLKLITTTTEEV